MPNTILIEHNPNDIVTITLNRPEVHNAFDDVMIAEFNEILKQINHDNNVRLVILKARGKSFSAGADLQWMQQMVTYSEEENFQDALALAQLMKNLKTLSAPTLAVVEGAAFGGGVGLVACCDLVIASEKASFCFSEVKMGLIPAVISPYVLAAIGTRATQRYFLTAEVVSAEKAALLGLVHEVVASVEIESTTEKWTQQLLKNSPRAMVAVKQLLRDVAFKACDQELMELTSQAIAKQRTSAEGQEGLKAFLEKRTANWIIKS